MFRSWRPRSEGKGNSLSYMGNRSNISLLCLTMFMALLVAGFVWAQKNDQESDTRPDLIQIRSMQAYGKLQLPAVRFAHDLHTDTLAQQGKGCVTCHPQVNNNFVFTFSELQAASKEEAQNLYHEQCVQCHREQKKQGRSSGPLEGECRICHQKGNPDPAEYSGAGMNLALHARHIEAQNWDCAACHHTYDAQNQKLVPAFGKELGCRACHQKDQRIALSSLFQAPDENLFRPEVSAAYLAGQEPPSWSQAAHLSCVNCHAQAGETSPDGQDPKAPVSCQGCHGQEKSLADDSQGTVPRLNLGQPDAALISPPPADVRAVSSKTLDHNLMPPVPFDHKVHEQSAETCRACHHQSRLKSCSQCHTLQGSQKGDMITLDQAMHSQNSPSAAWAATGKIPKAGWSAPDAMFSRKKMPWLGMRTIVASATTPKDQDIKNFWTCPRRNAPKEPRICS